MPFPCNGILRIQSNLPRVLSVLVLEIASCLIPYINSFLILNWEWSSFLFQDLVFLKWQPCHFSVMVSSCLWCMPSMLAVKTDVPPRSAPALELQSRAESSVAICTASSGPNTGSNPEEGRVLNKKNKKTGSYNWFIGGAYINIIILKNYHFYSIQKLKKNQFQIFPYVLVQKLYKITYTKGGLASFTNLIRF